MSRLYNFSSTQEVSELLEKMAGAEHSLATQISRQAGQKECRFAHLSAGKPQSDITTAIPKQEAATLTVQDEHRRIAKREDELEKLRDELEALKIDFDCFRKEFE